jgi:hypothetical protein
MQVHAREIYSMNASRQFQETAKRRFCVIDESGIGEVGRARRVPLGLSLRMKLRLRTPSKHPITHCTESRSIAKSQR